MMETVNLIEKALNIRSFYHKIIAGNIANVETPNYKEKDIDFREELGRQMTGSRDVAVKERHNEENDSNSADGNTVNIENQMVKLTENSMMYSALIHVVTKKFSLMRYLINEGRR